MTDDSPWQDLKDAKAGINKAVKGVDDFATHSTSRVIGPLATKALDASKRAIQRWFEPDKSKPWKPAPPAPPRATTTWSFGGMFLKLLGHDPAKEGVHVDEPVDNQPEESALDISPEPPTEPETFDV